jgi:bifunctional UDP-N-acetylglucosamine pyrophosphorylase / glucosamine-1-phosphate N-acetyltransferase
MEMTAIVLAAGLGQRMQSNLPKVMHNIAGKPMLAHILTTLKDLNIKDIRVVASEALIKYPPVLKLKEIVSFDFIEQKERLGTAHAVLIGLNKKPKHPILVLNGDVPLIKAQTISKFISKFLESKANVACLAFTAKNPYGYGRLCTYGNDLVEIIEEVDATAEQRKINLCNSGVFAIDHKNVSHLIDVIISQDKLKDPKKEHYLPDIIRIANSQGLKCSYDIADSTEVVGINDKGQLAKAEKIMQSRLRKQALNNGVTMVDPKTVYLSMDTTFGRDVIIHPSVVIGENVTIGSNVEILSFTSIEGAIIGDNSKVGPFARLRSGTVLKGNNKVGNFVELKESTLHDNVKASHLSYIGDASIGENSNIGAGTIFCNYDGYEKHRTIIGSDVLIGSNSALVAPIEIKDGAIVGAGSVVTENVEKDTLSIARARQVNYLQKAELIRNRKQNKKVK